jgi:hypothetical protein
LARIDLKRQVAVDNVICPNCRTNRYVRWVSTANARDNPVCLREIEARVQAEGHHRRRCLSRSHSGDHAEDSILVQAQVVIPGRQRQNLVQVLPLHPELKLARSVAGVFPAFKHRNHDNLDLDWRNLCCGLRTE